MPKILFQESAAKVEIGFFSQIKSFENTTFGHVTEVRTTTQPIPHPTMELTTDEFPTLPSNMP